MLKQVQYRRIGDDVSHVGVVRYMILNQTCVFSGVTDASKSVSTVNGAECVINAIAEVEKLDPLAFTFFDLQTSRGYRNFSHGQFHFQELTVERKDDRLEVTHWQDTACPPEVVDAFGLSQVGI